MTAGGRQETSEFGGSVTLPVLNPIEGFHPLIDRNVEAVALQLIFNGLIKINKSLEPVPDLAESWTVSDDGLVWTFSLRHGVLFHDGEELTSRDVVYTIEEILGSEGAYAVSPLFANIVDVSGRDDYTVRIELRQPFAPLLHLLTIEILPSHVLEGKPDAVETFRKQPVGTGPFVVQPWQGETITLKAFDEYFEGRPFLDSAVLRYVPDKKVAWTELMQGNLSYVPDLDREDYEIIKQDERFTTYSFLDVFYHTVLINNEDKILSDPIVRKALSLAIDLDQLIEETLGGWADATSGPFIPGTWAYDESVPAVEFDLKAAKSLMAKSGWQDTDGDSVLDKDGEKLQISLLIDEGDVLKEAVAQAVKWQLFRLGVQVDVEHVELRDLFQTRLLPGDYQMALMQFNAAGDPDTFTFLFWHSSRIGATNVTRYSNQQVDRLIEQGRSEYDQEKRRAIYNRIHRIVSEDTASIFLFVRRIYTGASSQIEGIEVQPHRLFYSVRDWKIQAR